MQTLVGKKHFMKENLNFVHSSASTVLLCFEPLAEPIFRIGVSPAFTEDFFVDLTESSSLTGVAGRSVSRDETLVKLFSLTRGEGTSGVAERDPAGVSFWTLMLPVFFLRRSEAFDAVLPLLTCPPVVAPSSTSAVGVTLRDEFLECEPFRTLPLLTRLP